MCNNELSVNKTTFDEDDSENDIDDSINKVEVVNMPSINEYSSF